MSRIIAIPVCNGRISPLFDVAGKFAIFTVDKLEVSERYDADTSGDSGIEKVEKLKKVGANLIICSAIRRIFSELIIHRGMELIPGVIGDVDTVINAFLNNNLTVDDYSMPGCRWRQRFRRGQCPRYRDILNHNGRGRKR